METPRLPEPAAPGARANSGTGRTVELELVSVNNIARFDVLHSPTPESPGSALAGSVNLVPRSAFERARPGDIVIIAGKGHETVQEVGTEVLPFDDREVAREALHKVSARA